MLTRFKDRIQKFIYLIILLLEANNLFGQPENLLPEIDVNSGLPSNNVFVVKIDTDGRLWAGTEQGVFIANDFTNKFKNVQKSIQTNAVWAIEFYKNFVIIGTRYKGVYIFNTSKGDLTNHFAFSQTGLCRKIKVLKDTVFAATNSQPFYLTLSDKKWKIHSIKTTMNDGFFTDFCCFNNTIYASKYSDKNFNLSEFVNDKLIKSKHLTLNVLGDIAENTLSLASNKDELFIGGDGFYQRKNLKGETAIQKMRQSNNPKLFPIWDACFIDSTIFLGIGNPDNNKSGMLFQVGSSNINDISDNFYCQSLFTTNLKKDLWMGTFNVGLYYWPLAANAIDLSKNKFQESVYIPSTSQKGLLYNKYVLASVDWGTKKIKFIFYASTNKSLFDTKEILHATQWKDTVAVISGGQIFILKENGKIINKIIYRTNKGIANKIIKHNNELFLFSLHYDYLFKVNCKTFEVTTSKILSNNVSVSAWNNNILFSSKNSGLHYYDTAFHSLMPSIPSIESFCSNSDTLWLLKGGVIKSYKIDLKKYILYPLYEINYQNVVQGFFPAWLISLNNKLYTGSNAGIFELNKKTGKPTNYEYVGNLTGSKAPTTDGNSLYFNSNNYLSKYTPGLNKSNIDNKFKISTFPSNKISQFSSFHLKIVSDDYLLNRYTLKEIIVLKEDKTIDTFYTTSNQYYFSNGLAEGRYVLIVNINGVRYKKIYLKIHIPFSSSPFFYPALILILVIIIFLIFLNIILKKSYEKKILNNRLQLLKQNLNPHFVFNSLNLIYSLVLQGKNESAIKTITNFSDLHRYYLDNISRQKIPLSDELDFIESYLKLESERVELDDPFSFFIKCSQDEHLNSILVPPMILQPLVENAIKYAGIHDRQKMIWIDIQLLNKELVIGIENTVQLQEKDRKSGSGIGQKLVEERIDIYNKTFHEEVVFERNSTPRYFAEDYRCELKFPLKK